MNNISEQVKFYNPVRKEFLGYGDDAIYNTLKIMKNIIIESSQNPYVRRWAEKIVETANEDELSKIRKLYDFLISKSNFLKDPYGFELIKTPTVSLSLLEIGERPQLDCDDYTVLSLSLLKSIGFQVAMRATSYREDSKFQHVYGLVFIKNYGWVPLDLTKPKMGFNWEAPQPTRSIDVKI